MRVAGLFAGIGGFEAGFQRAGHEAAFLCEVEEGALAVLENRFSSVRLHRDISKLAALPRGIDVLTGGFPCQDLSQAGRTRGIEGAKSGIVSHVWRLLEKRRVPWVVLENVPFMLRLGRGRALHVVVSELERLGYRWAYRVVDARAFGLPQRRERVFIVASREHDPRGVLFADDAGCPPRLPDSPSAYGFYWTEGNTGVGWAVDALPPLKGGSAVGIPSPPAVFVSGSRIFKPDIRDAERLQGFAQGWTAPALDRVKAGFRWRLVGNAVNVEVANWLGRRLATPGTYDDSADAPLRENEPLPTAAWGDRKRGRFAVLRSKWPEATEPKPLLDFLAYPGEPLSLKAAGGFYRRALRAQERGALRLEEFFVEGLGTYVHSLEKSAARKKRG